MTISHRSWNIGPSHDPYGAEELTVKVGICEARWYSDGLYGYRLQLFEGGIRFRDIEWRGEDKQKLLKAQILFKRHVGVSVDGATDLAFRAKHRAHQEDPFGGRDPYFGGA